MTFFRTYVGRAATATTPQDPALPGQIAGSAVGHSLPADDWSQLDRFLILGSEGGTYYVGERALSLDDARSVARCIAADGPRVVRRAIEISESGRAPKSDPAVFALAVAAKLGNDATHKAAYLALPAVCRTGAHLMHFAGYAQAFGGWGRGMRRAVAAWFNARPASELALQAVKHQARDGWSTRDLLRLAHPRAASPSHDRLFHWIVKGEMPAGPPDPALALIDAFEAAGRATSAEEITRLIVERGLPREAVPTAWLREPEVWEALLPRLPMTAMLRSLATMTRVGLLTQGGAATRAVASRLGDEAALRGARLHPIAVQSALVAYRAGARGAATWTPVAAIVDALDAAFHRAIGTVEPSRARVLLALDVSGSMASEAIDGAPGLTPRVASAAMVLVTAATERDHGIVAFTGAPAGQPDNVVRALSELAISPRQRLDDVVAQLSSLPFGTTDCALPMRWALAHRRPVDVFVIYTDSETWVGAIHPVQALRAYRHAMGIDAKLVVVGLTSRGFSVADPTDAGMLDVVGFDAATPAVIADFARA